MLNRRKAMLGWLVYTAAKPIVKRAMKSKARRAVPGTRERSKGPKKAAILVALAAVVGGFMFWRSRKSEDVEPPES